MKKQLLIIGITFLLLAILFSGCGENQTNIGGRIIGDTDKVEMVSYSITAYDENKEKLGDGFLHNGDERIYIINGTVKNIIGGLLDRVYLGFRFYDVYDNFLHSKIYLMPRVEYNNTADFSVNYVYTQNGFYDVKKVDFYFFVIVE